MSTPATVPAGSAAFTRASDALRGAFDRFRSRGPHASAWGARAPLIAALSVLLVAGIAVLVTYRGFYDARLRALEATRVELAARRDEAAAAAERVRATGQRLQTVQHELESFNQDVLGTRKERLAAIIEDVYALTQKAGLVPSQIGYSMEDSVGVERLALTFSVQGRYADLKRLLFSFENNPRFLLVENVAVATDDREPDVLRLNLVVAHYFRPESPVAGRAPRPAAPRASAPRPAPLPAKAPPNAEGPE